MIKIHSPIPFPDKDKYVFKPKFIERYQAILGNRYQDFIDYSLSFKRRGIRVNTLKISLKELKTRLGNEWTLTPISWYNDAFWIEHKGQGEQQRRDVGNLIEHTLGYIYIQDPASAIPPLVLDPQPGDTVLDMCAAPGSKTTQMSQIMKNTGLIIANEMATDRLAALSTNVQRCGCSNVILIQTDASRINTSLRFDRILIDAPCSGVGTIRKSPRTINEWNPAQIERLARLDLRLLDKAYELLKPGGTLVYSTCTTEPDEDEYVVSEFVKKYADMTIVPIDLDIVRSPAITEFEGDVYHPDVKHALRIWPQDNDTEGFFVCKIQKKK